MYKIGENCKEKYDLKEKKCPQCGGKLKKQYTEEELKRFDVRPGVTGWAAVHGRKTNTVEARFEYDNYYAEHLSLWLDVKIFFMTIKSVFTNEGNEDNGAAEVKASADKQAEEMPMEQGKEE